MTSILFDAISLNGRPSGTRSRLVQLAPELARRGHAVTVAHGPLLDADAKAALGATTLREVSPVPGPGPARRLMLQPRIYRDLLRKAEPEAISAETWPMPRVAGLLALVHDLRYLNLRSPTRQIFEHFLREACGRAARVQTESRTVAQQLVQFGIDAGRIDLVPIAVPLPDLQQLAPVDGMAEPYVIVVGHDEPYKDLSLAGAVAEGLAKQGIPVLHAGRPAEKRSFRARRNPTSLTTPDAGQAAGSIASLGIISDDRRNALFHHAVAVLVPSRFEGFGLVPLEGLAAGAWVVASSIPAHREILGDAASFFPPGDPDAALALVMDAVRAGSEERTKRVKVGRARAAEFSPTHAAEAFEESLRTATIG